MVEDLKNTHSSNPEIAKPRILFSEREVIELFGRSFFAVVKIRKLVFPYIDNSNGKIQGRKNTTDHTFYSEQTMAKLVQIYLRYQLLASKDRRLNSNYNGITGLITEKEYEQMKIHPQWEKLVEKFNQHPKVMQLQLTLNSLVEKFVIKTYKFNQTPSSTIGTGQQFISTIKTRGKITTANS